MLYILSNFAASTLAADVEPGDMAFNLANSGSAFEGGTFVGIFWGANSASPWKDPTHEIVTANFDAGETITILARGQEGTTAAKWYANDNFAMIFSAAVYNALVAEVAGKTPLPQLIAETANAAISASQCNGANTFSNAGAGGAVTLSLPAGAAGLVVSFLVVAAQYLKVQTAGTDVFFSLDETGAAGGYMRSNVPGTFWKIMWDGSRWVVCQLNGQLSFDQ